MSVRLAHGRPPSDITPYQLKRFLKRVRVSLGLSKGAIENLVLAIDNCQPSGFLQGRICAIWHSQERLAQTFGLSKRQVGQIEAELVEAGLIRRAYPERKSRFGERIEGVIKQAAGINFAPLIEYAEYVRLLVNRQMQTDEDHKQLREHFQCLFRQVRELDNPDADEAAALILPRRRPTELTDIAKMQEVAEALETVLSDFSTDYGQPNMTVGSEENARLNTNKEKKTKTRIAEKAMEGRRLNTSPTHARLLAGPQLAEYIGLYA